MSDNAELVLIDIGNTRAKYCLEHQGRLSVSYYFERAEQIIAHCKASQRVVVASVGQAELTRQIMTLLAEKGIDALQLHSPVEQNGLTNGYQDAEKLGIDRWLAMLACRVKTDDAFVLIDAGSAVTCDFVTANGHHLGGWVLPGVKAMANSLQQVAPHLPQTSLAECADGSLDAGKTTEKGIQFGQLALWQGIGQQACDFMAMQTKNFEIFISGGNADDFIRCLTVSATKLEQAVFKGMQVALGRKK